MMKMVDSKIIDILLKKLRMSYMQKSPIKKFKIDRKRWLRLSKENELDDSCLLNSDNNKMCCLGFYSLARGLNKKYILDISEPSGLVKESGEYMLPELMYRKECSKIARKLMVINDNPNTSDEVKEKAIKNNFKKLGVKVEFYN